MGEGRFSKFLLGRNPGDVSRRELVARHQRKLKRGEEDARVRAIEVAEALAAREAQTRLTQQTQREESALQKEGERNRVVETIRQDLLNFFSTVVPALEQNPAQAASYKFPLSAFVSSTWRLYYTPSSHRIERVYKRVRRTMEVNESENLAILSKVTSLKEYRELEAFCKSQRYFLQIKREYQGDELKERERSRVQSSLTDSTHDQFMLGHIHYYLKVGVYPIPKESGFDRVVRYSSYWS